MNARRAHTRCLTSLKKRDDFVRARTQGRKWVSEGVILQAVARPRPAPHPSASGLEAPRPPCPASSSSPPAPETPLPLRFGITVTKKVDKRAVVRNRMPIVRAQIAAQ
ncbi:MAG TPA: ribonuclease P protein component, partial [Alphaproteobacteria bacterium]|nr:ribonuclease P protein component [Alphaproteobacteria bacterium]